MFGSEKDFQARALVFVEMRDVAELGELQIGVV
jgi:hypothetical protein